LNLDFNREVSGIFSPSNTWLNSVQFFDKIRSTFRSLSSRSVLLKEQFEILFILDNKDVVPL